MPAKLNLKLCNLDEVFLANKVQTALDIQINYHKWEENNVNKFAY